MEMNNHNHMGMPSLAVPMASHYEDSEYQVDYMLPTHYWGTDPHHLAHWSTPPAMVDPSIMPRGRPIRVEQSHPYSYYNPHYSHNDEDFYHGDHRFYYPDVAYPYAYNSLPANVNMPIHDSSRHLHKLGCDCAICCHGTNMGTYPETDLSKYSVDPLWAHNSGYIYEDAYTGFANLNSAQESIGGLSQSNIYPAGVENSWYNYDPPYRGSGMSRSDIKPIGWERDNPKSAINPIGSERDNSKSAIKPIGWERDNSKSAMKPIGGERKHNKLGSEENAESYDRDVPSQQSCVDAVESYDGGDLSELAWLDYAESHDGKVPSELGCVVSAESDDEEVPSELGCVENDESDDGEIPVEISYFSVLYDYDSGYDSQASKTGEDTSLSSTESGDDDETESDEISSDDETESDEIIDENLESTATVVRKEKTNKAKKSSSSRKRRSKQPIYHISWEGFDEPESETVGEVCHLCEVELSLSREDEYGDYEYYDLVDQPRDYQEVSVLPCGHAFHTKCLDQAIPDELLRDPICFLCLSCES